MDNMNTNTIMCNTSNNCMYMEEMCKEEEELQLLEEEEEEELA